MFNRLTKVGLPIVLLFISSILLTGCSLGKTQVGDSTVKPTNSQTAPVPTVSTQQAILTRPFVSLTPSSDAHRVTLKMAFIPKAITSFEYELIYFADFEGNKIERGVDTGGRAVDLAGKTEYSKEFLFGSESCSSGKCRYRYDEGVTEGTLTLKFKSAGGIDKFMTAFRIQNSLSAKNGLSTGDGGFILSPTGKTSGVALTMQTAGLPKQLDFIPRSSPYAIFPSTVVGKGSVSFSTTLAGGSIYGYNGKAWNQLATTVSGGQLTAETSGNFIFVVGE